MADSNLRSMTTGSHIWSLKDTVQVPLMGAASVSPSKEASSVPLKNLDPNASVSPSRSLWLGLTRCSMPPAPT